jgi:hypothetical protein
MAACCLRKGFNVNSCEICHGVDFQVAPYVFNGIKLGCIRWEEVGVNMALKDNRLNCLGPMWQETIPYQNHTLFQLSFEGSEEIGNTESVDISIRMKTKIEMDSVSFRGNAEGCDHRNLSMRPCALVQDGRLSPRCPTPAHQRSHQHPAFINKDQESVQA